ncbi:GerAB/ArcD/ProY family transporter [Clostridium sp.]|uniref:GerAB/ArcD/ProY family transporter n=1 Tax=Clostridium sp. TaxID=1506 RepID=UPI0035211364
MNKISAKHFILFVFGVTYISLKTYPSLFIAEGGRDTWLYTLIIYLIFFAFAMYLIYVMDSKKVYNINEIFTIGLSKTLGNIFLFLFAFGLFLAPLESAAVEANVVKSCFFLETPSWYIIIFFILPSVFLIGKSIRTLLTFIIIINIFIRS